MTSYGVHLCKGKGLDGTIIEGYYDPEEHTISNEVCILEVDPVSVFNVEVERLRFELIGERKTITLNKIETSQMSLL